MPVAAAPSARSGARGGSLAAGLPMGRRTPRGRERWYLLRMPEGREASLCAELKRLLPESVLSDAFVLRKERWMKRGGTWFLEPVNMYRGYAFAISSDAAGLAKSLARLTLPVELVGTEARSWAPLADEAAAWYASAMDASHVIRSSTAVIVDGALHVQSGPLVGQESRISKVDRHRRRCQVLVGEDDTAFTEQAPIDVPFKS
ncbi:hypothetical protein [Collinsella ihumii]|uniref:hypothetical protein n=1 Tax=Collinsella ihumii TaxID=1720204 RepID=UPI000A690E16|nr:hypothetical protein [Collinsella ihumii]